MKAFIHGIGENGKDILGTGFPEGGKVTKEYKTLNNLIKYSLKGFTGKFHIEAFYNWQDRYKKADIDIIVVNKKDK